MARVKLAGKLPSDKTGDNGLDVLATSLIRKPSEARYVIGWVINMQTTIKHEEDNFQAPTAAFVQIEGVLDPEDVKVVGKMIEKYRTRRRGETGVQETLDVDYADQLAEQRERKNRAVEPS